MTEGDDVVGRIKWAARRYAWLLMLVTAVTIALAVVIALRDARRPPEYHASALVIATQTGIKPEQLPRFGQAVFTSGAVAENVIRRTGLTISREELIPDRVSMAPVQETIAFEVTARAPAPDAAANLADAAATAFVEQLNLAGGAVGNFAIQDRARPPAEPAGRGVSPLLAAALGAVVGLVAAFSLLGVVLLVRRPITSAAEAAAHSGLPIIATLRLPHSPRHDTRLREVGGLTVLARRLANESGPVTYVLHSCAGGDAARSRVATLLTAALHRVGRRATHGVLETTVPRGLALPLAPDAPAQDGVTVLEGASLSNVSDIPAVPPEGARTILVVHEGCTLTALEQAEQQFMPDEVTGILFTRLAGRRVLRRWRSEPQRASATSAPAASPARSDVQYAAVGGKQKPTGTGTARDESVDMQSRLDGARTVTSEPGTRARKS